MRRAVVLASLAAALLAACGGGGPTAGGPDIDGAWVLEAGTLEDRPIPIVAGSRITLTIDGSEIGGTAACNLYGGTIAREGSDVRIDALTQTEMACDEPIMASEAAYVAALRAVRTAARDGDRLTLGGANVELRFGLLPPVPAAELVGTTWKLDSLISGESVSSVGGEPATLHLEEDGTLTGSTGCRSFRGRYVLSGDEVRVTALTAGERTCPADVVAQDGHVLAVLGDAFTVEIDGNRLTVAHRGQGLGYVASEGS